MSKSESLIFISMDVHQDTVTLAVFEGAGKEAARGRMTELRTRGTRASSRVHSARPPTPPHHYMVGRG